MDYNQFETQYNLHDAVLQSILINTQDLSIRMNCILSIPNDDWEIVGDKSLEKPIEIIFKNYTSCYMKIYNKKSKSDYEETILDTIYKTYPKYQYLKIYTNFSEMILKFESIKILGIN